LDSSWEIERLQHLLAVQPRYFELIMKNQIIDNRHRLDLTMSGSTDFNDVELRIEKQRLREIRMQISPTEKQQLVSIADSLKKRFQSLNNHVHFLLSTEGPDLPVNHEFIEFEEAENVSILDAQTNSIVDVDLKAIIPLDNDYIEDIHLLKWRLPTLESADLDESKFPIQEQPYTSGFKCNWKIQIIPSNPSRVEACFTISVAALSRNVQSRFGVLELRTLQSDLNNYPRIVVVMLMIGADFDHYAESHAHELVAQYATAGCSKAAAFAECWSDFTAVFRIIQLVREADWKSLALRTEKVYKHVFRHANFAAAIHTNDPDHNVIPSLCSHLLRKLNNNGSRKEGIDVLDRILERVQEHPKVPFMNDSQSH
jgi:Zn-dependent M16 (insulinase) family peptidase